MGFMLLAVSPALLYRWGHHEVCDKEPPLLTRFTEVCMKRSEAQALASSLDKNLGRARVSIAHAISDIDPSRNAELQHSIQQAMKTLDHAIKLLEPCRPAVSALALALNSALPADEEK